MSDSRGEPPPSESPSQKGSEEQPVASEDEQQPVVSEDEQQRALAALLAHRINELAALPEDEKRKEITSFISHTQIFSGPLPNPEAFAKYNEILPNAADRIVRMAEKEQEIRHEAQRGAIDNDRRRINATTIVALSIVGVAGVATWLGQELIAIPLGLAGVIGTIIRQIIVKRRRSE